MPAEARGALKKVKALGIVIAVLMIVFGCIACFAPLLGQQILIWTMIGGLFIYGVEEIIHYCTSPKAYRNGFSLACGIIWVLLCVSLFVSAVNADVVSSLIAIGSFDCFLAVMIAFSCIFNAVFGLTSIVNLHDMGVVFKITN